MKRGLILTLMLCLAAVLAGGWFLIQGSHAKEKLQESSGDFHLTAGTLEELKGVSWTTDDRTWRFTRNDGVWETEDCSGQVDQAVVQGLAERLVSLQANRKIENIDNLEGYGLDDPAITVTAEWKGGGSTAYSMGEETPFRDGYYLLMSTQSDTVYTIVAPLAPQ
ncbi:MAG: DUF4340 domain-containing protein [Clostridia bacterium]|nr:DUF4340 domain-containing protein [Clostridia bacterium]